jgi:SAM-dependent methyltransferase
LNNNRKQTENQKSYSGVRELAEFDSALINYNTYLVGKFINLSKFSQGKSVLDFGAGLGSLADLWFLHTGLKPDCIEIDDVCQRELKVKNYTVHTDLTSLSTKYDVVYSSNVLEHIEEDFKAIGEVKSVLKKDGLIVVYVPAMNLLFSDLDRKVGHYRRYSRADLVSKFENNDFEVISCEYVDSIGFVASLAIKLFGWRSRFNIGSSGSVQFYDHFIFPISVYLDRRGLRKVVGKNLLLVARIGA